MSCFIVYDLKSYTMKQLLLFSFVIFSLSIRAQCIENNSQNVNANNEEPKDNLPIIYNDMVRGQDFNGNYAIKGLKIGGGITSGLYTSGFGQRIGDKDEKIARDAYWNHNRIGGFLEVIYQLKTKSNISFGVSTTWNPLWKQGESFVTEPNI